MLHATQAGASSAPDFIGPRVGESVHARRKAFQARIAERAALLREQTLEPQNPHVVLPFAPKHLAAIESVAISVAHKKGCAERARREEREAQILRVVSVLKRIQMVVSDATGVRIADIVSTRRNQYDVDARQIAMFMCREYCSMSFAEIGRRFGGRDHTTVLHSCDKIAAIEAGPSGSRHLSMSAARCDAIRLIIHRVRSECQSWFLAKHEPPVSRRHPMLEGAGL